MAKWLENKTDVAYSVKVADKNIDKVLPVEILDANTGNILQAGILSLSDEEYAAVAENCRVIKNGIKKGTIKVHDSLPANAVTPSQKLAAALDENEKLKAELAALKSKKSKKEEE